MLNTRCPVTSSSIEHQVSKEVAALAAVDQVPEKDRTEKQKKFLAPRSGNPLPSKVAEERIQCFADFINGLVFHNQLDAVQLLIEQLQLDLSTMLPWSEEDDAGIGERRYYLGSATAVGP